MFGAGGAPLITSADVWDLVRSGVLMFIMVFAALPVGRRAFWNVYEKRKWMHYASSVGCVVMLLVCIAYLVDSTFNPFLYFRF
jgi:alginate O-acetyltransferase complex protein AlgI